MVLAEMATKLREVSERYGGIPDYLSAAGEIDRTASEFFKNQDMDSLRALNGAVARGVATLAVRGYRQVVVVHGDLPLAAGLHDVVGWPGVTLVPDIRRDGTNVCAVPTGAGFRFAYGPGSFRRHCEEAQRLGLELRELDIPGLRADVDHPADLENLAQLGPLAHIDQLGPSGK